MWCKSDHNDLKNLVSSRVMHNMISFKGKTLQKYKRMRTSSFLYQRSFIMFMERVLSFFLTYLDIIRLFV